MRIKFVAENKWSAWMLGVKHLQYKHAWKFPLLMLWILY